MGPALCWSAVAVDWWRVFIYFWRRASTDHRPLNMPTSLYDNDFHQWLDRTIALVRDGRFDEVDREILIDELESMGKRDRRELISHFAILIAHLLKWSCQASARSSGWLGSIAEQRLQITDQLEESPSLKGFVSEAVEKAYPKAVTLAERETGLARVTFPPSCPFSLRELTDDDFYPRP